MPKPFRLLISGYRVRCFSRLEYAKQAVTEASRRARGPVTATVLFLSNRTERRWYFNGLEWTVHD